MPKDDLNPEGDEPKDSLNPEEEEPGDDDLELDFEDPEDEPLFEEEPKDKPIDALAAYNAEMQKRGLNYNFKSWDDVAKSAKQIAAKFAKKGMDEIKPDPVEEPKKAEVAAVIPMDISERLLKVEQPESVFVIEQIKKDHPNKDVYEIWNSSEYYRKEAMVRSENERAKSRVTPPDGSPEGEPKEDPI
jgi:hypothetical protein